MKIVIKKRMIWLMLSVFLCSCTHSATLKPESLEDGFNPLSAMVQFYRGPLNHLSAVRHSECPMHPSCSQYSLQCFQKHGALIGGMMTFDRLLRCGRDELKLSPPVRIKGEWKCHDPVEKNDFWWDGK
jgi:putative component of membrane protein insertase Oxa1/YidC/SpoIIIJ protein YidD